MNARALLLASALSAAAGPAFAQGAEVDEVVVTADPLGRSDAAVISDVAVLRGDALAHRRQGTLGETLTSVPGVNADTFGAGAGRPVIRGQTAPRVRVLTDGADVIDASAVSPDHAVGGDPMLLDRIEILRGPSALLYGGGAIGGAVNLVDSKIPTRSPQGGEGVAEARMGTADRERSFVVGATVGAGPFAFRLEAVDRQAEDYDVPRYRAPAPPHDHDDDEAHGAHDEAEPFSRVAGSFSDARTVTGGASLIGSQGYVGLAYTEQTSLYGLPGHSHDYEGCHPHGDSLHCGDHDHGDGDHDHDDHVDGEVPVVDLLSRRVDLRGEWANPLAGIERLRLRANHTDYRHHEREAGAIATTFTNQGYTVRLEAQHAPVGGLRGVVGVQIGETDLEAAGEEGFIGPTRTQNAALFILETLERGDWRLEGALRQEWQEASAKDGAQPDRTHRPFSASIAANWRFAPAYAATVTFARSQRAPTVQELYAYGVHMATNTFEMGAADLDEETVLTLEFGLAKTEGTTTFEVNAYRYAYEGYIFADTLDQYEAFRLIRYVAADATFTGVDGELVHRLSPTWSGAVFGDYVRAELDAGGDLPRIPAGRLGARLDGAQGRWSGSLEYVRVFEQDKIADFESVTPGHDLLSALLAFDMPIGAANGQIYLSGTNLLDRTVLNHASFLSQAAPLRGRNVVLGLRARF